MIRTTVTDKVAIMLHFFVFFCLCSTLSYGHDVSHSGDFDSLSTPDDFVLIVRPADISFRAWREKIEAVGIPGRHWFPPDAALVAGKLTSEQLMVLSDLSTELVDSLPDAEFQSLSLRSPVLRIAASAFVHLSEGVRQTADYGRTHWYGDELLNDVLIPPQISEMTVKGTCSATSLHKSNSEYMLGSVTVSVMLPESIGGTDPSAEDWDSSRETNVSNGVVQGMNDLSNYYNRVASLTPSWTYHFYFGRTDTRAQTTYEPITRSHSEENLWVEEIYNNFGYSAYSGMHEKGRMFNGDQRTSDGTAWAITVFVVDSLVDSDGKFTDGWFAWAWYGGPHQVQTYDNNGWGISRMNWVTRHETGHNFYARDEYASSGCLCTDSSGYISYDNENCNNSCLSNVDCIMNESNRQQGVCYYTGGQVGWGDLDGDDIPDPVDIEPETNIVAYSPDPSPAAVLTYNGTATMQALTNQNVYNYRCDRNILTIANVQWRVDGGTWQAATASDGVFDSDSEAYTFTTASLSNGLHTIEARAVDTVGQVDSTPASDEVTINACDPPAAPGGVAATGECAGVSVSWNSVPDADSYQVRRGDACGDQLASFDAPASPFIDDTATPGVTYTYWVVSISICGNSGNSACVSAARLDNPSPTISGAAANTCPSETVTLTTEAGFSIYQWSRNGSPLGGETTSSLVVTQTGDYTVSYQGGNGCSAVSSVHGVTIAACEPFIEYLSHSGPVAIEEDGDGVMEAGEKWQVTVTVTNSGQLAAADVLASLSGEGLLVCNNPGEFGAMNVNSDSQYIFQFIVDSSAWYDTLSCGDSLSFDLVSKSSDGGLYSYPDDANFTSVIVGQPGSTNTENATSASIMNVKNSTKSEAFSPAFTVVPPITSASVTFSLGDHPDPTTCVRVELEAPDNATTVLKEAGIALASPYDVITFYNNHGTGVYTLLVTELADCGGGPDNVDCTNTGMSVSITAPGNCDTSGFTCSTSGVGEVSDDSGHLFIVSPGTGSNVDFRFEDIAAGNYNIYVSNLCQTHPFQVTDAAYGKRACGVTINADLGDMLEVVDFDPGATITGPTGILYFLVSADNGPGTEGSLGNDSVPTPRSADGACN